MTLSDSMVPAAGPERRKGGRKSGVKALLRSFVPTDVRWRFDVIRRTARGALRKTPHSRTCPVCSYVGPFHPFGWPIRPEARCPSCRSLERHRFFKLWLDRNPQSISGKDVLHFAPEPGVSKILKPLAGRYVTADLDASKADVQINIENMDLPSASFDVIVCFHVLEHVDDRAALREMARVLRPGGVALLMFPTNPTAPTYENPAITDPEDRKVHFGQHDHVRLFGYDARERIEAAGFTCSMATSDGLDAVQYGVGRYQMFVARPLGG